MIDGGCSFTEVIENLVFAHGRQIKIGRSCKYVFDRLGFLNPADKSRHCDNPVEVFLSR